MSRKVSKCEVQPSKPVLWRSIAGSWNEVHAAGSRYWWDNALRESPETWVIQRTRRGRIGFWFSGKEWRVSAGDVHVFRYTEPSLYGVKDRLGGAYVCDWVALHGAGLSEHLTWLRERYGPVFPGGTEPTFRDALSRAIASLSMRRRPAPVTRAATVSRLVFVLAELAENRSEASLTIAQRLADRIAAEPLAPWSLKRLAADHGVSREHLCRTFRERHGAPPHAFLTRARRRRALWLLRHTALPLSRVAELCGFEHAYTLARHIRDETGRSPGVFRSHHQRTTRPTDVKRSVAST